MKKNWVLIGKILKSHGIKGEMKLSNRDSSSSLTIGCELYFEGSEIGRKVIGLKGINDSLIKVEDIESRNDADQFVGSNVYVLTESLPGTSSEEFYFHRILNFSLINSNSLSNLGVILKYYNNGAQTIAVVRPAEGKLIDIPLIKGSIKEIDYKNKRILMEVNEGLLNL